MKISKKKMLAPNGRAKTPGESKVGDVLPKKAAADVPTMLAGTLHQQWVRCGRENCRCANGDLHGPYLYRFYREGGRLRKAYVKRADVAAVMAACRARQDELQREREFKLAVREQIAGNRVRWRLLLEGIKRLERGEW